MTILWELSILDCQHHAIEPYADHPNGVYIAQCGHRLMAAAVAYLASPHADFVNGVTLRVDGGITGTA